MTHRPPLSDTTLPDGWQEALASEAERLREVRKTCDHSAYRNFAKDGRCCPACGTFMVDFGND